MSIKDWLVAMALGTLLAFVFVQSVGIWLQKLLVIGG